MHLHYFNTEGRGNKDKRSLSSVSKIVLAGLVGAVLLAACGSSSPAASSSTSGSSSPSTSKPPYVIHAVLSETGAAAVLGSREAKMLKAQIDAINAAGGINGQQLALDIKDNQSNPSLSVQLATPWVAAHVPFFLNGSFVATDSAVDALATSNGPLIYDLSPGAYPPPDSYVFSVGVNEIVNTAVYLNFFKSKGWTKIAIIHSTDGTGQDGYNKLKAALALPANSGFSLVAQESFDPTAVSVATQLSVIKAANPQALIVWTTGAPAGVVFKGMSSLGMQGIPSLVVDSNAGQSELNAFQSILPTQTYFTVPEEYLPLSQLSGGVKSEVSSFGTLLAPLNGYPNDAWSFSYEAMEVMLSALKHLGTGATASALKNYLQTNITNFPTVVGPLTFTTSNHQGTNAQEVSVVRWSNGSFLKVFSGSGS